MKKMLLTIGLALLATVGHCADITVKSFSPSSDQAQTLGTATSRWGTVYTKNISDGKGNEVQVGELSEAAAFAAELNHNTLTTESRAAENSHPIEAITGLSEILRPATQTAEGLMSPQDKLKLDAISVGGGAASDHNELSGRDENDQHPIGAITGLEDVLDAKASKMVATATSDGLMSTDDKLKLDELTVSVKATADDVKAGIDDKKYVTPFGLAALVTSGGFNAERLITTSGSVTLDNAAGVALVVVIGGGGGGGAGNNGGGGRGGGKTSATIGGITCAASGGGGGGRGYYSGYFTAQGAGGGGGGAGGGGSGASNGQDGSTTKGGDGGGLYAGVGGNNGDIAANGNGIGFDGTAGITGNPGTGATNGMGAKAGIGGTGGITFGAALNGTNYGKAGNGVTAPQGSSGGGGAGGACLYIVTLPKNASFTASIGAGGATGSGGVAGTPGTQGCIYIIYRKA